MGKTNQRRATQIHDNNVGCTWGFIRMFYSRRHDPKLILDRKQGSTRRSFSGFAGRGRSRNKSRDFDEIDQDGGNTEECSTTKPTVKRLMEGEFGKPKHSKKIPNDEVQRILADLGHDVCLDKSDMQNSKPPKGVANPSADIGIASSSGSLDPGGSKCIKQAEEEDGLELALSDFMGQIYKCNDEVSDDDCRDKSELYPELESLIHTKLNEYKNPPCDLDYRKTPVSEEKQLVDNKCICNRHVGARLEPKNMLEKTNIVEGTKIMNRRELAIKTKSKDSRNMFFWKKDKSSRAYAPEGSSLQPVNKIVILKPNPRRGFDPTETTASTFSRQQSGTTQDPECSTFSVKEVRRRFRIVASETKKGRPLMIEGDVKRDPCWPKNSAFTIKKGSRQAPSDNAEDDVRPSNGGKQTQTNDERGGINSDMSTSKDASSFYAEAKKHLTEILKHKSHTDKYPSPTVEISRSLVGMLSRPQCSTSSSPGTTPRVKECIDHSHQEENICAAHKAEREEPAEGDKAEEDSESVECGTSEALDEQADQERHNYKEEDTQQGVELDDVVCTEETDNRDQSETIQTAQCIPAEQQRYNSPLEMMDGTEQGKEQAETCPGSPENVVELLENEEPKTPGPSASSEPISQEETDEKQEQPSPVSVLEPFFHEEVDSPENKSTTKCVVRQDVSSQHQYYQDDRSDQEGLFWIGRSFPSPSCYSSLRVSRRFPPPPLSLSLSGGEASRREDGSGGRPPMYILGLGLAVAFAGRAVFVADARLSPFFSGWIPAASGVGAWSPLSFSMSPWWTHCRIGGNRGRFNNLLDGGICRSRLLMWRLEAAASLLAGRGGEEERCCGETRGVVELFLAGRGGEGKELSAPSSSASRRRCCSVLRDLSSGGTYLGSFPSIRLGDEGRGVSRRCAILLLDSHQGSSSASPGSFPTAACFTSLFNMVERRPLPPSTSATVSSGRRHKVIFNLQADMPLRRPFSCGVVRSRLPVPSGVVPGDVEVGCTELWNCRTGEGAGPNCVPLIFHRVLCARCKGMSVISRFLVALSVKCTSVDFE